MNKISQRLSDNSKLINESINKYLIQGNDKYQQLFDSVKYSIVNGGKRIRPYLTLEFNRLCKGSDEATLPYACAVEMVHTYSLIHDDLPCMDNDDLRRGIPTNHKVYGEATALLAGDVLLTYAFEIIANNQLTSTENRLNAIKLLSNSIGMYGMIGGQQLDIIGENVKYDFDTLKYMQYLKTGKLLIASCVLGCYAAGADGDMIKAAEIYGEKIGLAFQIIDDILDVTGDSELLGKTTGSDSANNKTTFLSFMTVDEAYKYAENLTNEACESIIKLPDSDILCDTARYLLTRKK